MQRGHQCACCTPTEDDGGNTDQHRLRARTFSVEEHAPLAVQFCEVGAKLLLQRFEDLRRVVAINAEVVQYPSIRRDPVLGQSLSFYE